MAERPLQHFRYIQVVEGSQISVLQVNSWNYELDCDPLRRSHQQDS